MASTNKHGRREQRSDYPIDYSKTVYTKNQIKPTMTITVTRDNQFTGENYAADTHLPQGQPLVIMCFA